MGLIVLVPVELHLQHGSYGTVPIEQHLKHGSYSTSVSITPLKTWFLPH